MFIRGLDRLALVLGPRPFAAMLKIIGPAMKSNAGQLTPDRFEALVTELRHNDPHVMRQMFHQYLATSTATARSRPASAIPLLVGHLLDDGVPGVADVVDDDVPPAEGPHRGLHEPLREADPDNAADPGDGLPPTASMAATVSFAEASSRSWTTTAAPSEASLSAIAAPMPRPEPGDGANLAVQLHARSADGRLGPIVSICSSMLGVVQGYSVRRPSLNAYDSADPWVWPGYRREVSSKDG